MKLDSSRQLTIVFVAVLVPAAATLVWLGLRLLEQDRILWAQRELERQEAAADTIVRGVAQILADAERRLAEGRVPEGAVLLSRTHGRVTAAPLALLAWVPGRAAFSERVDTRFDAIERRLEYPPGDGGAAALRAYRRMLTSADPAVRAGALMRSARVHRKGRRLAAALADYRELRRLDSTTVTGMPADLAARRAICSVLAELGDRAALDGEVASLEEDFIRGRWALDRVTWELVAAELEGQLGRALSIEPSRLAMSRAADWFHAGGISGSGRHVMDIDHGPITVLWRDQGADAKALVVPPALLLSWMRTANPYSNAIQVALSGASGATVDGTSQVPDGRISRRLAADTGLPWTLLIRRGPDWSSGSELHSRRRLLAAGLAAIGILLACGSYLIWRVVQRELAVARLQAEFVSAVSHEFRTPVTSLRHTIELLQEDDEVGLDKRRVFYGVLARSTERLHRLVESLLDFGRMEGGRKPYDLRPIDPAVLAQTVGREFASDPAARGFSIDVQVDPGRPAIVRADTEALTHAVWNLLDNAVKYSPGRSTVTIRIAPHPSGVAISVADEGLGLPASERGSVFLKFVRGEQARRLGIEGTGVGLAIVSHIVSAHGGTIELDSEEGRGSTFRIVLPAAS